MKPKEMSVKESVVHFVVGFKSLPRIAVCAAGPSKDCATNPCYPTRSPVYHIWIPDIHYSLKTNWLKQTISLFIIWTTIILVKSTNNLVFLTNFIVEPVLSLVHLTQSLLHLYHNLVSLTNIMVVHIMNNWIGCFN